jgi:hypothetical protein
MNGGLQTSERGQAVVKAFENCLKVTDDAKGRLHNLSLPGRRPDHWRLPQYSHQSVRQSVINSNTTGISMSINNNGGGQPFNVMQPTILANRIMMII